MKFCAECRFWQAPAPLPPLRPRQYVPRARVNPRDGECRYNPPKWEPAPADGWCGKWEAKEAAPAPTPTA